MEATPNVIQRAAPTPRLSIIIATWNAASTFERCLLSITEQTFSDWELLIADGASTDGTIELIHQHAKQISWWRSQKDAGIYDAWNQALMHASGEYVTFLGADDIYHASDTLGHIFAAIGNEEFDLVTGRARMIDKAGCVMHESGRPWDYRRVERRMTISHPGTLHRRTLFDRHGAFDIRYRIVSDYDFMLRLPPDLRTRHLDMIIVDIADGGISRNHWWLMLKERYRVQAQCPRIGPWRAAFHFADKLWRILLGKILGIPH